jgi:hypothetical protein
LPNTMLFVVGSRVNDWGWRVLSPKRRPESALGSPRMRVPSADVPLEFAQMPKVANGAAGVVVVVEVLAVVDAWALGDSGVVVLDDVVGVLAG